MPNRGSAKCAVNFHQISKRCLDINFFKPPNPVEDIEKSVFFSVGTWFYFTHVLTMLHVTSPGRYPLPHPAPAQSCQPFCPLAQIIGNQSHLIFPALPSDGNKGKPEICCLWVAGKLKSKSNNSKEPRCSSGDLHDHNPLPANSHGKSLW